MAKPLGRSRLAARRTKPAWAGRRGRAFMVLAAFVVIGAGAVLLVRQTGGLELARLLAGVDDMATSAYGPAPRQPLAGAFAPRPMPLCGAGPRVDCVVDGDTLWLAGEKIRILNIDAPETRSRCAAEKRRAAAATRELARLVDGRPIRVDRQGEDRYGRTLAVVSTPDGDVGDLLVGDGLAVTWSGRREAAETWCGSQSAT